MKSKVESSPVKKEREFPLIAKSTDSDLVILFDTSSSGTILSTTFGNGIGDYSDGYISCFDKDEWKILDSVTITFES